MNVNTAYLFPLCMLLFALAPQSSLAQEPPEQSNRELIKRFRDGFMQGCQSVQTPGVSDQTRYCTCLANSYEARYSGMTLETISGLANAAGEVGSQLVNVMMTPEAKICVTKS